MEKTTYETKTLSIAYHDFYCDDCNKHLGKVKEYDDGYYPSLGDFELQFFVLREWYALKKNLCDECKNKLVSKICTTLEEVGFRPDKN